MLLFLALASLGVYALVMAGYASNNKFSLFGAIRASAQMISYELAMTLAVVAVLLPVGSFNLSDVVAYQRQHLWFVIPQALGFFVFLIASFAETNRLPFDLPEAESELVAGYHTEYSAMRFASFFMAEYITMTTLSALAATLYFGGWSLPGVDLGDGWAGRRRSASACCSPRWPVHGLLRLGALDLPPLPLRPAHAPGVEGAAAAGDRQRGLHGGGDARRLDVTVELAIFLLFAALALVSALVVVSHRNPVYSTMSLVVTLLSLAALFVLLGAPFIAALQVLIYTGAILVLFLFVIMLLNIGREEIGTGRARPEGGRRRRRAGLPRHGGAALLARPSAAEAGPLTPDLVSLEGAGRGLFDDYLLTFELVGLLLLVAVIAATVVARKPEPRASGPAPSASRPRPGEEAR